MSRFRPTSNVPPPVAYVGTASVAESLERIAGTLERIHVTLQVHGNAIDGANNTLEDIAALMMNNTPAKQMEWAAANLPELVAKAREIAQSVREPVKHDDIVSRAKHVVAKAEREAVAREALAERRRAAEREFRYAAEKIRRKPRRKAPSRAKQRVNTRQPSED